MRETDDEKRAEREDSVLKTGLMLTVIMEKLKEGRGKRGKNELNFRFSLPKKRFSLKFS